ncbi:MAG: hypothetical protein ACTSRG_11585 [Candidatus Helarchaeota archaeon]
MMHEKEIKKLNPEMFCGFEEEIKNLMDTKQFFIDEWKIAYKSMDVKEITHFLNHWTEELCTLKSNSSMDVLSKGIISDFLFKQLINKYPGSLISNNLKEKLIEKMEQKINPLKILQTKLSELLEKGESDEIRKEISILFDASDNFLGNKEYLDDEINNLLFNVLKNHQNKDLDLNTLIFISKLYLNFLENKKSDINQALFFINLGSYFFNKKKSGIAKKCLLKSKHIYEELGLEKDKIKVEMILKSMSEKKTSKKKTKKKRQ